MESPVLMDVTLRDGAYLFDHNYPLDLFRDVAHLLDAAGVSYLEVGHGMSVGARDKGVFAAGERDVVYARAARESVTQARLGMVALPRFASAKDLEELRPYLDFIRVGTNANAYEDAEELIAGAKKLGYEVFFQMIRTSRVPPRTAAKAAKWLQSQGVDVVYLVDSGGIWSPWEVRPYVEEALAAVSIPLGIHAHDHLGTALATTLEAIRIGCRWADGSLCGAGRGAGNAQIELLAAHLVRLGLKPGLNEEVLAMASQRLAEFLPRETRGVSWQDYFPASLGIDVHPISFFLNVCREAGVSLPDYLRALSKRSGMVEIGESDLIAALEEVGGDARFLKERLGGKSA
ncbi:MAG TPA: hypothetical protein VFX30_14175 [bacterium]|nr:hypothetical protein [bacterium]